MLQEAKVKWESHHFDSYHLSLRHTGAFGYSHVYSLVTDSTVSSCTESYTSWTDGHTTSSTCPLDRGDTVHTLFAKIEEGLLSKQLVIVDYDPIYGVPVEINIADPRPPDASNESLADTDSGYFTTIDFSFPVP